MSWTLVNHLITNNTTSSGVTSSEADFTGSDLIIGVLEWYTGDVTPNFSDSLDNVWTLLTPQVNTNGTGLAMYYCVNPNVGPTETFESDNQYANVAAVGFSGAGSSPFDQTDGAAGTGGTIQAGSVTPSASGELIIAAVAVGQGSGAISIDSGFTITDSGLFAPAPFGLALAYLIQTSAAPVNPTWTIPSGGFGSGATTATFKVGTGVTRSLFRQSPMDGLGAGGSFFSNPMGV